MRLEKEKVRCNAPTESNERYELQLHSSRQHGSPFYAVLTTTADYASEPVKEPLTLVDALLTRIHSRPREIDKICNELSDSFALG
jgi:hypothetical protein